MEDQESNPMHELPFTMSMLDIVLQHATEAKAAKVTQIDLVIGKLTGIVPECVQFQFDVLKKNTIANEAVLSFHQPENELRCRNCDIVYTPDGNNLRCPECKKKNIEVITGREYYVESIEVE